MPRVRDIARREHARHRALERLVDQDAVVHLEAGAAGERDARHHADADDDEIALDHPAGGGTHPRHGAVALERLDALAECELDAVVAWTSR